MKRFIEYGAGTAAVFFGLMLFVLGPLGCRLLAEKGPDAAAAGAQAASDSISSGSGWVGALVAGAIAAGGALLGIKLGVGPKQKKGNGDGTS